MPNFPRSTPETHSAQPFRKAHADKRFAARRPWSIRWVRRRTPHRPIRPAKRQPLPPPKVLPSSEALGFLFCSSNRAVLHVLCFDGLTNCFSRNPFALISI